MPQPAGHSDASDAQSAYSFRHGTFQELQSRYRSAVSNWIIGLLIVVAIALGLNAAVTAGFKVWELQNRAYQFEFGKRLKQPGSQEWPSILLAAGFAAVPFISMIIAAVASHCTINTVTLRQLSNRLIWIARYQDQIVGWIVLVQKANYTLVAGVYVDPEHRRQGVGSHLLWNCLEHTQRPIYLICQSHLQSFYSRLGFVSVPTSDMPKELKRSRLMKMGLFQKPVQPPPLISTPFSLTPEMSIHLISDEWTRFHIYATFWRRKRFRQSRLYVLALVALIIITPFCLSHVILWIVQTIFGVTALGYFNVSLLGMQVSTLAIALWLILLLISLFIIFLRWQEWIVKEGDRPIAYIHLSPRSTCSVLYHLHVEPQYPQRIIADNLFVYFHRRVQFPLYFACLQSDRQFYTKLGFTRADQNQFPLEMKILQFGQTVPLQLTHDAALKLRSQLAQPEEPDTDSHS